MFYNWKFKLWQKIDRFIQSKRPVCKHAYETVDPAFAHRRTDIEVIQCKICDDISSFLTVRGIRQVGDVNAPVPIYDEEIVPTGELDNTVDPAYRPIRRNLDGSEEALRILPNGEKVWPDAKLGQSVVEVDRNTGKSKKAPSKNRRSRRSRA